MIPDANPSIWTIGWLEVLVLCQSISGNKNNTLW